MNRRLYRSRTDAVLGGVAGGVAEWLGWDPSLVRVAWVILVPFTGGVALLVYLVMWVVVPEASAAPSATGEAPSTPSSPPFGAERGSLVLGLILVAAGVFFLVREFVPQIQWGRVWPVALLLIGAVLLIGSLRRRG
ncbi:MAG: PspC domain-containing protein [Candidatus Limnocylindria bacterium]